MEFIHVDSSNLEAVKYDESNATLTIRFKDNSIYEYYDVPEYVFHELMNAESKGKYAHINIYKAYNQQRIA